MKINTVSLSRTIPTGAYANVKIGMEGTLEGEESPFDALDKLKRLIDNWYIHEYPPQESKPIDPDLIKYQGIQVNAVPSPPQVIDYKQKESLEIAIDNATSLESLAEIKEACGKAGLATQYMKRLNQLIIK